MQKIRDMLISSARQQYEDSIMKDTDYKKAFTAYLNTF